MHILTESLVTLKQTISLVLPKTFHNTACSIYFPQTMCLLLKYFPARIMLLTTDFNHSSYTYQCIATIRTPDTTNRITTIEPNPTIREGCCNGDGILVP